MDPQRRCYLLPASHCVLSPVHAASVTILFNGGRGGSGELVLDAYV
jgi:hypothetical protein